MSHSSEVKRRTGDDDIKKTIGIIIGICVMMICLCACGQEETKPMEAELDLDQIGESIEMKDGFIPQIGIVLGSGLHPLADEIEVVQTIPYEEKPGFPYSTVEGHEGQYILGYLEGVPVILMDGRIHYYEGYTMEEVVTPDRIMAKLGAETIILTHAVGSMREDFKPGELACITDHIASFVPNPLIGQNDEELGDRFVGMTDAYDQSLRTIAHKAAEELDIELKDSVYMQVTGPTFETPAEAEAYASLGAETVGMSTAVETIALRHMGVRVLGISCITNYCPNVVSESTSHEEVQEAADKAADNMVSLVRRTVGMIAKT